MTYNEYRDTYHNTIRKYPDITSLYRDETDTKNIVYTLTHYEKHGRKWVEVDSGKELVDFLTYMNCIDVNASAFMKGLGGYERTETAYTKHGLIPICNTSISPDRSKKTVRRFSFDTKSIEELLTNH